MQLIVNIKHFLSGMSLSWMPTTEQGIRWVTVSQGWAEIKVSP